MMSLKLIKKDKKQEEFANLADYKNKYNSFSWKDYEKELDWFTNHKLNAAYNAIDRNAKNYRKNKAKIIYMEMLRWRNTHKPKPSFAQKELK